MLTVSLLLQATQQMEERLDKFIETNTALDLGSQDASLPPDAVAIARFVHNQVRLHIIFEL